jgi:hypothetical protein
VHRSSIAEALLLRTNYLGFEGGRRMAPRFVFIAQLRQLRSWITKLVKQVWNLLKPVWCYFRKKIQYKVKGKPIDTCPTVDTVLLALLLLSLFVALAVVALVRPTYHIKRLVIVINSIISVVLIAVFGIDVRKKIVHKQQRPYARNLGNTVLTVLSTTMALTTMYGVFWHNRLNEVIVRRDTDVIVGQCLCMLNV